MNLENFEYKIYENCFALCVGISNFKNKEDTKENLNSIAVNNSKEMRRILEDQYGFNVTQLIDEKATRENIIEELKNLKEKNSGMENNLGIFSTQKVQRELSLSFWF